MTLERKKKSIDMMKIDKLKIAQITKERFHSDLDTCG